MVVGISGQLVALEVFLSRWANETAGERVAYNSAPFNDASSVLASHTISPFAMPPGLSRAPVHFDLASAQLQVLAGRLLAFIEGNPALQGVAVPGPADPTFLGSGSGGSGGSGGGGLGDPIQADPTPEPTTIALVGSGLLLGAMGRRRQRRKQSREA
jgi:hypothetical protein